MYCSSRMNVLFKIACIKKYACKYKYIMYCIFNCIFYNVSCNVFTHWRKTMASIVGKHEVCIITYVKIYLKDNFSKCRKTTTHLMLPA